MNNYKYKSGGYTWLDNQMNYFWEWVVKLMPLWLAPNLITFIGWIFVILSYANMLRYDYTFKKDIPASAFFFAAFCIFFYSTLDAIDGKQARRTKTSSPLGQLFDHGCDSFSLAFFMLAICQAINATSNLAFFIFIVTQASFWVSNWTEYNTGVLRTKVGQFGVTEGEFTCMFIHILTGIFGQSMWSNTIVEVLPFTLETSNEIVLTILNFKLGMALVFFYGGMLLSMCIVMTTVTILSNHNKVKQIC